MSTCMRGIAGISALLALATACSGSDHTTPNSSTGGSGGGSMAGTSSGAGIGGLNASAGAGGSTVGTGGAAGFAGGPRIDIGSQQSASKLDVLFVIDNSVSMAGKQKVLADSIPSFVAQLTKLVTDIHFGAITTSIGGHGGSVCATPVSADDHLDDQAQLIPSKRTGVASYQNSGYLAFDAAGKTGVTDAAALATDLQATILAAGETGCGYEAPLEAMYRFLVDPEPPLSVQLVGQQSTPSDANGTLLKQRNSFLRPDSSVAIVILSDENDCSIRDDGIGWFVGAQSRMPLSTSACQTNPNDLCCRSCAQYEASPPAGCSPVAQDSQCKNIPAGQSFATWDALHDSLNLRCFKQHARFGFDLLYPVERYTNALENPKILNRAGQLVDNPLLAARDGKGPRSASLISVSLIVGAPWQDLATPASLSAAGTLEFLDGASLLSSQRWPLLLGDPAKNVPPSDAFMIEAIEPRTGQNPLTSSKIVDPGSTNPQANPINGHEHHAPDFSDLQYACTFPLKTPVICAPGALCECAADDNGDSTYLTNVNSPLCQPPAGGPVGTTQYYGKAYPGARELTLAQQLGARAVVGSICPKDLSNSPSAAFAYKSALTALSTRLSATLK